MILEVAVLNVRPGETRAFEASFRKAESLIARTEGYLGHQLLKCCDPFPRVDHYEPVFDSDA